VTQTPTLYETLGAETGIRVAVDQFYDRVVADPRLTAYFDGVDMLGLRRHQVEMLSAATGGPKSYTGAEMAAAHAGRGIDNGAFDRVVGHLQDTLVALGVDELTITTVLGALSPLRSDIVTV
jgi:hemoglobin